MGKNRQVKNGGGRRPSAPGLKWTIVTLSTLCTGEACQSDCHNRAETVGPTPWELLWCTWPPIQWQKHRWSNTGCWPYSLRSWEEMELDFTVSPTIHSRWTQGLNLQTIENNLGVYLCHFRPGGIFLSHIGNPEATGENTDNTIKQKPQEQFWVGKDATQSGKANKRDIWNKY